MFGFSAPKLLLLALIIWGVFAITREFRKRQAPPPAPRGGPGPVARRDAPAADAEELIRCHRCGTFVPQVGARPCGRQDCPALSGPSA